MCGSPSAASSRAAMAASFPLMGFVNSSISKRFMWLEASAVSAVVGGRIRESLQSFGEGGESSEVDSGRSDFDSTSLQVLIQRRSLPLPAEAAQLALLLARFDDGSN